MTNYSLPYFGQINLSSLDEEYITDIELNGHKIHIDINFQHKTITLSKMDSIKNFIENIDKFDKLNKAHIGNDYINENSEFVKEYIDFHLEELSKEKLSGLIDFDNKSIKPGEQLLGKLKLVRVGLYPDGKYQSTNFAVFDYTLNESWASQNRITDQIIVVNTNELGELDHLAWES